MSSGEEKSLPPTLRKLRQARQRGELARSKELVTAVVTVATLACLFMSVPKLSSSFSDALRAAAALEGQSFTAALGTLGPRLAWAAAEFLVPLLALVVAAAVVTGAISNGGLVFAMDQIMPKLERLDPLKGFGRLFKLRNLIELGKSTLKLAVVMAACSLLLRDTVNALVQQPACGLPCVPGLVRSMLQPLLVSCCSIFLFLGLLDLALQRWLFKRELRMTRTEHKRDRKDADGDPELSSRRRKERSEDAQVGVPTGIKNATFVIQSRDTVLAFRYVRGRTGVPVLVARAGLEGSGPLASEARRRGIPVVFDPEAVLLLAKVVQIGKLSPRTAFGPLVRVMRQAGLIG